MSEKVLILSGSARKGGNSDMLADEFARGAQEAGAEVEKVRIVDLEIGGCLGCGACRKNGGSCVRRDDMQEVYGKLRAVDHIVFAAPVYFYTWNAQTKTVIDRTFAVEPELTGKAFYLLSTAAAPEERYLQVMRDSFTNYVDCFRVGGNTVGGMVFGLGANARGEVRDTPAMREAYELGKGVLR